MENQNSNRRTTKKKKKNWIPVIAAFLGVYIFLQMYLVNANGVDTVRAAEGYINDSIVSQGIVCRDEIVLTNNSGGVVDYIMENGERTSKGNILAQVYPTYSDIEKIVYLRNRQQTLDDINTAANYADGGVLDISTTRKRLSAQLSELSQLSSVKDYDGVLDSLTNLTLSLNKIGVATGRTTDFSSAVSQLESEINTTKSEIRPAITTLYSPYTGYFIQSVDGYENIATVENIETMTYEQAMDIINSSADYSHNPDEYGKIITNYRWSLVTFVDTAEAENIYEGRTLNISLDINKNEFKKATVEKVVDMDDKTMVVLECTVMDRHTAAARIVDCEVLFRQYTGIKIPKTAIHFVDGQMGVYVNFSNVVYFRKIDPIYEDANYVIVPKTKSENNQVELYDSIIVKGRNLYDGKYL